MTFNTKSLINYAYPFIFHEFWNITNITYVVIEFDNFFPLIMPDKFLPIPSSLASDLQKIVMMENEDLIKKAMEEKSSYVIPFLAPQEFKDKIVKRNMKMAQLKSLIKENNLST